MVIGHVVIGADDWLAGNGLPVRTSRLASE